MTQVNLYRDNNWIIDKLQKSLDDHYTSTKLTYKS